jgi:hypothetical protein
VSDLRGPGIISVLGMGVLSACGGTPVASRLDPAQATVTVDGAAFVADVAPGPAGEVLTAAGARPTAGLAITVARADGAALGAADGAIAKRAAVAACDDAGGRFVPGAIGRPQATGAWVFNGACA